MAIALREDTEDRTTYPADSPEHAAAPFLSAWKQRNYGHMAARLPQVLRDSPQKEAGRLRRVFGEKVLRAFSLLETEDVAPAISAIKVRLHVEEAGVERRLVSPVRTIYEDKYATPELRGETGSNWHVHENCIWDATLGTETGI